MARTRRAVAAAPERRRQQRRFSWVVLSALVAVLAMEACSWATAPASMPQEQMLEDLEYRIDLMVCKDAIRARLTLKSLGPGRYQAEVSGEPQGMLKMLSGSRQDSYRTEMIWREGKLAPLVYREESRHQGKRHLKEYRFDYERGRLELWQWKENQGIMVCKWQTALNGAIHDPLSALYNCRLGLMGPVREGETFKLRGIPYPKPEEIEVRIGPETEAGRKTMISLANQGLKKNQGVIFAYLDNDRVPQHLWTNDRTIGKISGELLPGGKALSGALPAY